MPVQATLCGPEPSLSVQVEPFATDHASVEDPPTSIVAGVAVNDVIDVSTHELVGTSHLHEPVEQTVHALLSEHPHVPAMHAVPAVETVQSAHVVPGLPHDPGSVVPATHVRVLSQQPPLQTGFVEQSDEHLPFSHASFAPHWLESVQPHALATQA